MTRTKLLSFAMGFFFALGVFAQEKNSGASTEWDFDQYRKTYPEQISRIRTSQSGRTNLEPALEFHLEKKRAPKNNRQLRGQILTAWRDLLGPSARNTGPLHPRLLEEKEFPHYTRRKVEYEGDPGEPIRAWLFLPKNPTQKKAPAILCLHQTAREGKDQTAGLDPANPQLAFGPLLAARGYVALVPDAICFGERYQVGGKFYCHYGDAVRIYRGNAGRSIMSKIIDDAMRAVDYLASLPQVDNQRLGCIGHSHGGYGTLFAMAFDERIKVGVESCGFATFRADNLPERWYRRTALMPRLGTFEGNMAEAPVDFHHLFAAIAPRPLLLSVAMKDNGFSQVGDVKWIEQNVKKVFDRAHVPENFVVYTFDGPHGFPDSACDVAWEFLDRHLENPPRN